MFKRLITPLFILFISISLLSVSPLFAEQNTQQSVQEYLQYPKQIAADIQKTQVEIEVVIPFRDGWDGSIGGSGTVIAKTDKAENTVYFIHTNPHIVNDIEKVLEEYKEARIRIYILGKDRSRDEIEAEIVAWNWRVESLLLRAEVPQAQLENFKFKVAKISERMPISSTEEKFSDNLLADFVYAGGYPGRELADSCGKVTQYVENELINTRIYSFRLSKTMHVAFAGLVGPGQSGGGIFIANEKTGKPEWVGTTTLRSLEQLTIAIPVDVIVEEFLKQIPELKGLINFPSFKLNPIPGNESKTVIYKDLQKDNN